MSIQRVGDLEVAQDLEFQRGQWLVERISWMLMLVVALAGLLGLFGTGLLARAEARSSNGLLVEYGRFERFNAPAELVFHVPGDAVAEDGTFTVALTRDYLQAVQVQAITPEPNEVRADGDWLAYEFSVASPSKVSVVFHLQHDAIGPRGLRVRLGAGEPVDIGQFVYP